MNLIKKQLVLNKYLDMMKRIKLNVRGIMQEKLTETYANVLKYDQNKNEAILFCDYSDFDIPVEFNFSQVNVIKSQISIRTIMKLRAVTQEHGQPFDMIPMGHKTICNFVFLKKDLETLMKLLPIVSDWYDSENILEFVE